MRVREQQGNQKGYWVTVESLVLLATSFLFCIPLMAQDSSFDKFGRRVIPEIVKLSDDKRIPENVYKENDSRSIGESIVSRVAATRTASRYSAVPFNAFKNAQLHYYFSFQDLKPADLSRRGILNIFQVEEKDLYNTRGARQLRHRETANKLAGIKIEETKSTTDEANYVRPKYVGLDVNLGKELEFATEGLDHFGEAVAVLKPEVMLRATYTAFDSGAFSQGFPGPKREVRSLTEPFLYAPRGGSSQYFEAQVWGELDLRDIQEFLVPSGTSSRLLAQLKEMGLPVYQYAEVRDFGRYRRIRDKLLYAGSLEKQKALEFSLRMSRKSLRGQQSQVGQCSSLFTSLTN